MIVIKIYSYIAIYSLAIGHSVTVTASAAKAQIQPYISGQSVSRGAGEGGMPFPKNCP